MLERDFHTFIKNASFSSPTYVVLDDGSHTSANLGNDHGFISGKY